MFTQEFEKTAISKELYHRAADKAAGKAQSSRDMINIYNRAKSDSLKPGGQAINREGIANMHGRSSKDLAKRTAQEKKFRSAGMRAKSSIPNKPGVVQSVAKSVKGGGWKLPAALTVGGLATGALGMKLMGSDKSKDNIYL